MGTPPSAQWVDPALLLTDQCLSRWAIWAELLWVLLDGLGADVCPSSGGTCAVGAQALRVAACSSAEGWAWPSASSGPWACATLRRAPASRRVWCSHLCRAVGTRGGAGRGLEPDLLLSVSDVPAHTADEQGDRLPEAVRVAVRAVLVPWAGRACGLHLLASAAVCTSCRTQAPVRVHSAGPSSLPCSSLGRTGAQARSVRRKAKPGLQLACQVRRERDPGIRLYRNQDSSVVKPTN